MSTSRGAFMVLLFSSAAAAGELPKLELATAHPHFTVRFPAGWSRTTGWEYRNASRPEEQIVIAFDEPVQRLSDADIEKVVKASVDARFEVLAGESKSKITRPYRDALLRSSKTLSARGGGILPGVPTSFHFRVVADAARVVTVSVYSYAAKPAADFDARAKQILDTIELKPDP